MKRDTHRIVQERAGAARPGGPQHRRSSARFCRAKPAKARLKSHTRWNRIRVHGRRAACCSLTCHCHSRATDVVDRAAGQTTGRGTNAGHVPILGAARAYSRPLGSRIRRRRHSYRTEAHYFDHIRFEAGGQATLLRLEWASSRELTLPHGRPRAHIQYEPRV